jgi:hypothetical protein
VVLLPKRFFIKCRCDTEMKSAERWDTQQKRFELKTDIEAE